MINITYNRATLKVTATGHALSGESGHDLVCAAVSVLMYTLAANVRQLVDYDKKTFRRPVIRMDKGKAEISINPVHDGVGVARLKYDAVCAGFELLAINDGEHVSYELIT